MLLMNILFNFYNINIITDSKYKFSLCPAQRQLRGLCWVLCSEWMTVWYIKRTSVCIHSCSLIQSYWHGASKLEGETEDTLKEIATDILSKVHICTVFVLQQRRSYHWGNWGSCLMYKSCGGQSNLHSNIKNLQPSIEILCQWLISSAISGSSPRKVAKTMHHDCRLTC